MNNYELYHHGVKGMRWGVRKDRSSTTSHKSTSSRKGLSPGAKKAIKISLQLAGTAAVGYVLIKNQNKLAVALYKQNLKSSKKATMKVLDEIGPAIVNRQTGETITDPDILRKLGI